MKMWLIRAAVVLVAGGLIGALAWNYSAETPDAVHHLPVNGAKITVEQFRPPAQEAAQTKHPAILMLHGMDGAELYGRYYREYARTLANAGFQVFYVHYFDASPYEDLFGFDEEELGQTILSDRDGWIDVTTQLVAQIAEREDVDADHIGLLGFSLGGFVSLSAMQKMADEGHAGEVAAIVEFFAGLFEDGHGNSVVEVDHFPPTLILHGEQDERVPVEKAYELDRKLTAAAVEHEIKTYPGKGHGILGDDAGERTIAFFKKHLRAE